MKILLAAAAIAVAFVLPASAKSMICTGPTGIDYQAIYDGKFVRLKNATWSAKLPVIDNSYGTITTKKNKKGIYVQISFDQGNGTGLINYFKGKPGKSFQNETGEYRAYQQDHCRSGGQSVRQSEPSSPLTGIKQKCISEWPGDYRMQKYCIDRQIEAYNALLGY